MKVFLIAVIGTLALILILRHIFRPWEKRKDWLNRLSPTLRWLNAAGSILIAANKGTFRYLGGAGNPVGEKNYVPSLKKSLWNYWEIQDHTQAVDEMRYLITTGMRARYSQEMAKLEAVYSGCGEEELIEAAKAVNPSANEDSYLPKMLSAWRRYGENALLGSTMAFATLCSARLFHGFNCKSDRPVVFSKRVIDNKWLIGAFLLGLVLITAVVMIPGLHNIFQVQTLTITQLLTVYGLAAVNIPIIQILKAIRMALKKR